MKKYLLLLGVTMMLGGAVQAQVTQPVIPPGKIAVFKAGTSDGLWPMVTARVAPCFVQVFDPVTTNQSSPLVSVAMSITSSIPGSVWINHHAGSEGGGLSRSVDRQFLCLEGYVGNILSPTAAKPSTDPTVNRGIVTLDAFTNPISVLSTPTSWFGIPLGSATGTQDNPTGIASLDGTNFYGTGNFAPIGPSTGELDGTLYYDSDGDNLQEVQQFIQAAGEARIVGGMLLVATTASKAGFNGLFNFIDPSTGDVVPLPWVPNVPNPYFNFAFTNLYLNWDISPVNPQNIANFDMDPAHTVAYGADQTFGIIKLTNNSGVWLPAPYYFSSTNLGTLKQTSGNQGCFGICVDFSGTNPVIYATTMENGTPTNYPGGLGVNTAAGHQNNNRIISIVDTGVSPGTNYVANTLAVAVTTNEFFGGIDFTPNLAPLITTNPVNYQTIVGGSAPFSVAVQSVYALSYQWLQNGTNLSGANSATLNLTSLDITYAGNTYQCVITNNYGAVTSAVAILDVTLTPVVAQVTATNQVIGYVGATKTFPSVSAVGTQPFTSYQWYNQSMQPLVDDGVKYSGSTTPSLTISNLTIADSGNYYIAIGNAAGTSATNPVVVFTVKYQLPYINPPSPATTFVGTPTSLTADQAGGTAPLTYQWYNGTTALTTASGEFGNPSGTYSGPGSDTLTIAANTTADSGNYKVVYTNPGGSVTSLVAAVSVIVPPAHTFVSYTNQVYSQGFDVLPDPGTQGVSKGVTQASGVSVNSINNPMDPGFINGIAYSLANPFDFAYPVITTSYIGGLGLGTGATNIVGTKGNLSGWYGVADTNSAADGVDGISRFGAQDGDQSTGGVIDFGPNDVNNGILGTNRSLGLLSTSTTGSSAFGLKLVNNSGKTLNYINLSYLGELWRNNKAFRTMSFSYAVDPTANTFVLQSEPEGDTNGYPQIIPGTIRVPSMAFSFPTNDGSVLAFDGTQASNQVSLVVSNMALATPWQPNGALWLIWSINYYGQGTGQGYSIDNLKFSASVAPSTLVTPLSINGYNGKTVAISGSGAAATATINFTNAPGLTFSIHSTNNIAVPTSTWPVIGTVTDSTTPGVYQFIDPNPATNGESYYFISIP